MKIVMIGIVLCLLFVSFLPNIIASDNIIQEKQFPVGFGVGKVFGIKQYCTEDSVTCFLFIPPLGKRTLDKNRFYGHDGILFVYGEYQWFADAPPAFFNIVR